MWEQRNAAVFVASTFRDCGERRGVARRVIEKLGLRPILVDHGSATNRPTVAECVAQAAAADLVICMVGGRRGTVPTADNPECRSITEMEFFAAADRRVFLFPVEAENSAGETAEDWEHVRRFREVVVPSLCTAKATDDRHFGTDLYELLETWLHDRADKHRGSLLTRVRAAMDAPASRIWERNLARQLQTRPATSSSVPDLLRLPVIRIHRFEPRPDAPIGVAPAADAAPPDAAPEVDPEVDAADVETLVGGRRRAVVIGPVGAGKSTFLHNAARRWHERSPRHLAVRMESVALVGAADLYVAAMAAVRGIAESGIAGEPPHEADHHAREILRRAADDGHLLLLIDGLDQTTTDPQQMHVLKLVLKLDGAIPAIVATRPSDAVRQMAIEFEEWAPRRLPTRDCVVQFVEWWTEAHGVRSDRIEALKRRLSGDQRLRSLLASPMIATLQCWVLATSTDDPRLTVTDLTRRTIELLLRDWPLETGRSPVSSAAVTALLQLIASTTARSGGRPTTAQIAEEAIRASLMDFQAVERSVNQLVETSGILVRVRNDPEGVVRFFHPSIGDYFLASWVATDPARLELLTSGAQNRIAPFRAGRDAAVGAELVESYARALEANPTRETETIEAVVRETSIDAAREAVLVDLVATVQCRHSAPWSQFHQSDLLEACIQSAEDSGVLRRLGSELAAIDAGWRAVGVFSENPGPAQEHLDSDADACATVERGLAADSLAINVRALSLAGLSRRQSFLPLVEPAVRSDSRGVRTFGWWALGLLRARVTAESAAPALADSEHWTVRMTAAAACVESVDDQVVPLLLRQAAASEPAVRVRALYALWNAMQREIPEELRRAVSLRALDEIESGRSAAAVDPALRCLAASRSGASPEFERIRAVVVARLRDENSQWRGGAWRAAADLKILVDPATVDRALAAYDDTRTLDGLMRYMEAFPRSAQAHVGAVARTVLRHDLGGCSTRAAYALRALDDEEVVDHALLRAAESSHQADLVRALRVVGHGRFGLKPEPERPADPDVGVRTWLAERLDRAGVVSVLVRGFARAEPEIGALICDAVSNWTDLRTVEFLDRASRSEHAVVRNAAERQLRWVLRFVAMRPMTDLRGLLQRLVQSTDSHVRASAASWIGWQRLASKVDLLLPLLVDEDPVVRKKAAGVVGALLPGCPRETAASALQLLLSALESETDADVRSRLHSALKRGVPLPRRRARSQPGEPTD